MSFMRLHPAASGCLQRLSACHGGWQKHAAPSPPHVCWKLGVMQLCRGLTINMHSGHGLYGCELLIARKSFQGNGMHSGHGLYDSRDICDSLDIYGTMKCAIRSHGDLARVSTGLGRMHRVESST
jgi:hypothetical protein